MNEQILKYLDKQQGSDFSTVVVSLKREKSHEVIGLNSARCWAFFSSPYSLMRKVGTYQYIKIKLMPEMRHRG